jgi:cyclopropane-fatty-acyl-phospholipid synthase
MDGWWDCEQLDEMMTRILAAGLSDRVRARVTILDAARAILFNLQSRRRAFTIGEKHYDIGNDLYERMLDRRMIYSCGYWKDARTLDEAQEAKLDLSARKLGLEPGMKVLDIGCGWGGAARFIAERYGCEVVGVTVSREQVEYAQARRGDLPVEIRLQDYRDVGEKFDRILSIGMFEHVGAKNYDTFMQTARRLLSDDGLFLLHTIGGNRSVIQGDPWIARYIFPNSMLPSARQITTAAEGRFVLEDWHNFGPYYDTTLLHWAKNFDRAWPDLREAYGDRFYRMWKFYLLTCAAGFRVRNIQLWQVVLSPSGVPGGYQSVR